MSSHKKKRKKRRDKLVLNLLIIVALVLVIFEGKLVLTMVQYRSSSRSTVATGNSGTKKTAQDSAEEPETDETDASAQPVQTPVEVTSSNALEATLAGLSAHAGQQVQAAEAAESTTLPTVSDPNSPAIVPAAASSVDDSYFSDAAFIGDSRMEGFRMASGITQGQFFTSVGMSLSSMRNDSIIQTADGNITVAAALSGGSYNKIYIMLGTNDLGEYDWDSFREGFTSTIERFQEIQPNAIIYICSVIYLEESKISDTSYINNENVDTINSILLQVCKDQGYYYLDLNEILTNGYGSLTEGASSDGVHLYADYCSQMLDYLKSHYVSFASADTELESESEEA